MGLWSMNNKYKQFEQRKQDHIELALNADNQASESNVFDRLHLQHEAIPDMNFDDIDISSYRLGVKVPKPFIVSSMTAGHQDARYINRHLMAACAKNGWAMGVGSQRRELTDPIAEKEWQPLCRDFPQVDLYGNLGIAQLITTPLSQVERLVDSIAAKGLIIHCNPLQECIQPEGTPLFKGSWQALQQVVNHLSVPVIVKETGCGFSAKTFKRLDEMGVAAVDVSGLGGTHWGRIEGLRASMEPLRQQAAVTFRNWGINTIQSVMDAQFLSLSYELWGSGGVRQGLDAAKLFALGATTVGFAQSMLKPALESVDAVNQRMLAIEYELKVAMFCTGSGVLSDLREAVCH